jgi:hypothetical protein
MMRGWTISKMLLRGSSKAFKKIKRPRSATHFASVTIRCCSHRHQWWFKMWRTSTSLTTTTATTQEPPVDSPPTLITIHHPARRQAAWGVIRVGPSRTCTKERVLRERSKRGKFNSSSLVGISKVSFSS